MKIRTIRTKGNALGRSLGALVSLFVPIAALAQGSLTPPGPPAPMMKTLDQMEPRTPISSLPCTITSSGSYYLATNLTGAASEHGIRILADHVTIDLRGFALLGGGGGGACGIVVSNDHVNLKICNGSIANWSAQGVLATDARNSQFEQLRISQNGSDGLKAGKGCTITACVAEGNQGEGISVLERCLIQNCNSCNNSNGFKLQGYGGRISDCVAACNTNCGIVVQGVICSVNNCTATSNGQDGINVFDGCRIDVCTVIINGRHGIMTGDGCTVKNCTSNGNSGDGIQVGTTCCWVNGNTANGNGSAGIRPAGKSRIDDNLVYWNNVGIICTLNGTNFVARNTAHANTVADYSIAAGNQDAAVVASPGHGFVNQTPWSNFSY
ncbi:MAG: right-handed parallel beta-helix repeat-containing protein [Verrucomicrobiota bacterium]|jgi:hypothetical protein